MKNLKYFRAKAILLMFILVLVLTTLSCRKEKPTYNMPQEFKDYVMFPEGSYWIYEDSITNNIDSISLYKTNMLVKEDDHVYCNCKYETITQEFYSSFSNNIFLRYIEPFLADFENKYAYYLNSMSGYIFIFPQSSFFDPFKYKYFNSIIINNAIYESVHVFERKMQGEDILIHYFVKHIGIIKRKIITTNNDTIVWELKNYHIN